MWVPRARDVTDHQKKCAIKLKPGRGGRKKKRFPKFLDFTTRRKGIVSREDGEEAWRGKFTSDLNI